MEIAYRTNEPADGPALNQLMEDAWPDHPLIDPESCGFRPTPAGLFQLYDD